MTSNQAHAHQKDHPHLGVAIVTQAEFEAVELEAPICNSDTVDCLSLAEIYETAYNQHEQASEETLARVFNLIFHILFMHFKPEDVAEPYGPIMHMNGRHTMIPSDLRGEQSDILATVVPNVNNPGLRARLSDIAWINNRRRSDMAHLAINAYCDAVQTLLDDKAKFSQTSSSTCDTEMLYRACQIAHKTGWKGSDGSRLKSLVQKVTQDTFNQEDLTRFIRVANLSLQFSIDKPEVLAFRAEKLVEIKDLGSFMSRELWQCAASAHKYSRNNIEHNRCLKSAAECLVALANNYDSKGIGAVKHLMDAIQELRRIPNTQERRQQLEEHLREVQPSISDEMHTITTKIDLTKLVESARGHVSGLNLAQALKVFALLDRSPDPEVLRERAREQAKEYVFASTSPLLIVDNEGKVTGKSPGFFSNVEDDNSRLRHIIAQTVTLRSELTAASRINPARLQIHAEHLLERYDFLCLCSMSPFIPGDRVDLFSLAFARFFGGDFLSALHILVPQLENSLRYVLKQTGKESSYIRSNMIQEDMTLSSLLKNERQSLEDIFGPAIVCVIENLFDFSGGPRIRNQLAHGLISDQECYSGYGIYACWFIFHLCCLPLLPHWDHLTTYMERIQT